MGTLLLDTGIASLLHPKKRGTALLAAYVPDLKGQVLALSFQSVAELYFWAEQNHWGNPQRHALERLISGFIVIPYEVELARVWARVMAEARARGKRLEAGDAWIAATAVHRAIPLVTHDRDIAGSPISGLKTIYHP